MKGGNSQPNMNAFIDIPIVLASRLRRRPSRTMSGDAQRPCNLLDLNVFVRIVKQKFRHFLCFDEFFYLRAASPGNKYGRPFQTCIAFPQNAILSVRSLRFLRESRPCFSESRHCRRYAISFSASRIEAGKSGRTAQETVLTVFFKRLKRNFSAVPSCFISSLANPFASRSLS